MRPRIALTMGDPAGVGPEVIARALADPRIRALARFVVIGDRRAFSLPRGIELRVPRGLPRTKIRVGEVMASHGAAALAAIEDAIALAKGGEVQALVTAPIHKQAMELAGVRLIGHTEILAERTGTRDYSLMLVHGHLRVAHVTCHQPLAAAVASITTDRVMTAIRLTYQVLLRLGIREPSIGVAGLNPHAGEGGVLGDEDRRVIHPAVMMARLKGVLASGPHPPDTIFPRLVSRELDAVIAQYHDQGHIPFKLLTFRHRRGQAGMGAVHGVNVTLGLPFVRTSVDHGVAFEIAGQGVADASSMKESIRLACRLANRDARP
jgi:4-hydroxythreonine-4-phosphate dehydrogenase